MDLYNCLIFDEIWIIEVINRVTNFFFFQYNLLRFQSEVSRVAYRQC